MRDTRHYNKSLRTVKWKYADLSRHISTPSVGTGHQALVQRPDSKFHRKSAKVCC